MLYITEFVYSVLKLITEWFIEEKWSLFVFMGKCFLFTLFSVCVVGKSSVLTMGYVPLNHKCYQDRKFVFETFLLRRPLSEVCTQLSAFVSHLMFLLGSNMISLSPVRTAR